MNCNVNNTQQSLVTIFGTDVTNNPSDSDVKNFYNLYLIKCTGSFGRFTTFRTNYKCKGTDIADLCGINYKLYTDSTTITEQILNNYTIRGILIGGGGGGGGGSKTNNANASRTDGGPGGGGAVNIFEYKNTTGTTINNCVLTIGNGGGGGGVSPWSDNNGYNGYNGGSTSLVIGVNTYNAGGGGGGGCGYLAGGNVTYGDNGLSTGGIVNWNGSNDVTKSSYMINQPSNTKYPNYYSLMNTPWGAPGKGGWSNYNNAATGDSGNKGFALIYIFYDN